MFTHRVSYLTSQAGAGWKLALVLSGTIELWGAQCAKAVSRWIIRMYCCQSMHISLSPLSCPRITETFCNWFFFYPFEKRQQPEEKEIITWGLLQQWDLELFCFLGKFLQVDCQDKQRCVSVCRTVFTVLLRCNHTETVPMCLLQQHFIDKTGRGNSMCIFQRNK